MFSGSPNSLRNLDKGRLLGGPGHAAKADARAKELAPILADIRKGGAPSLSRIVAELNARSIPSPRGGKWHKSQVRRTLARIDGG